MEDKKKLHVFAVMKLVIIKHSLMYAKITCTQQAIPSREQ